MAVTIAPSVEAMDAIVTRINSGSGGAYTLPIAATYGTIKIDPLEELSTLRVDVTSDGEKQLARFINGEDATQHKIRVWVRKKLDSAENSVVDPVKLICDQIRQRLDNWDSADRRVRVFEVNPDQQKSPDKTLLNENGMFVSSLLLIVTVEPS